MSSAANSSEAAARAMAASILANVEGLKRSQYSAAAAATLFVYDIILTMDLEVVHVWKRLRFNLPTMFYFLNRYVSLIFFLALFYTQSEFRGPLSDTTCKAPFFTLGLIIGHSAWTGVMALRVAALWRSKPKLVITIWTLWVLTNISVVIFSMMSYLSLVSLQVYDPISKQCGVSGPPPNLHLASMGTYSPIVPMVYETFLTVLTAVKAFDFGQKFSASSIPKLYGVLARDGIVYFVISILITIANLICFFTRPVSELYLFLFIYWSFLSTVVARLALNLHEARAEGIHVPSVAGRPFTATNPSHHPFGITIRPQTHHHHGFGGGSDSTDATERGTTRFVLSSAADPPKSGMGVMVVKETFSSAEGEDWNVHPYSRQSSFSMKPLGREL